MFYILISFLVLVGRDPSYTLPLSKYTDRKKKDIKVYFKSKLDVLTPKKRVTLTL